MSKEDSMVGRAIWTARSHPDNDEKKIRLWDKAMMLSTLVNSFLLISFFIVAFLVSFVFSSVSVMLGATPQDDWSNSSLKLFFLIIFLLCLSIALTASVYKKWLISLASDMFGATADMKRLLDDKKVASGLKKQVKWRYYLFGAVSVFFAFLFRFFKPFNLSSWHSTDVDVIGNIMAKVGRKATALRHFKELEERYCSSTLLPLPKRTQCATSYALACKWVWPFLNAEEKDACKKDVEEIRSHYELSPEVLIRIKEFLGEDDTEEMQALREKYSN
jgi:hypothetical protein